MKGQLVIHVEYIKILSSCLFKKKLAFTINAINLRNTTEIILSNAESFGEVQILHGTIRLWCLERVNFQLEVSLQICAHKKDGLLRSLFCGVHSLNNLQFREKVGSTSPIHLGIKSKYIFEVITCSSCKRLHTIDARYNMVICSGFSSRLSLAMVMV